MKPSALLDDLINMKIEGRPGFKPLARLRLLCALFG